MRRFWLAWLIAGVAVVAIFVWWGSVNPTDERATGGAEARQGIVAAVMAIPALLALLRLRKLDDDSAAWYVFPGLIGLGVLAVALLAAFASDDIVTCTALRDFGLTEPYCRTPPAVRAAVLVETIAFWVAFGGTALLLLRRRSRAAMSL